MTPSSRSADSLARVPTPGDQPPGDLLARLSSLFQGSRPLDDALSRLLEGLVEGLKAQRADLLLLDEPGGRLVSRCSAGAPADPAAGGRASLSAMTDMVAAALRKQEPQVSDPKGHVSAAAIPLVAWGRVTGVFALQGLDRAALASHMQTLVAIAAQTGLAIERARLQEERELAVREMTHLQRATAALQESLPLEEILQRILEGASDGLQCGRAMLFLLDPARNILRGARLAVRGPKSSARPVSAEVEALHSLAVPADDPAEALSAAVLTGCPQLVDGAPGALPLHTEVAGRMGLAGCVVVPLRARDRSVGIAVLDRFPGDQLPPAEGLHMVMAFAFQAGLAIERTQVEERLRQSERRYRQFIERSPDGIVETTPEGRILWANDRLLSLLGYTRDELMAINVGDLYVSPAQRDEVLRSVRELGHVEGVSIGIRRKDGSVRQLSLSCRLGGDADQPVLDSIIRDETERHEVERRMRALTQAVDHSADAILGVDEQGNVTAWNRGARSIFGYTAAEIMGRPYSTLVPSDLMDEFCHVIRVRVDTEGHLQGFQTERLHKSGRRIPVSITVTRLRHDDGARGYSVVVRDITERRKEEQRRRLLSSITEQSPDAILSLDGEGRITSWNRGAQKMFGYVDEEIVGSPWVLLAPPEREAEYHAVVTRGKAETAGETPRAADTVARTRDGRIVPVRLFASVLRSAAGEPIGWSVILRDLTEQATLAEISERLKEELFSRNRLEGIVGHSAAMDDVRDRVKRVARFNSSVLLLGQSGTGKEIVANAVHYNSPRREKPFIKVNCAAIPEHLLESELFGIERNVATGVDGRIGRFELADGGTLFLDEIGDMSLATQAKILRVLQEREFERVGGKKIIKVDVRIIAATNKDLEAEIQARRFREDLYYRLNVIVIALPPLAQRREDIDPLIDHFLERFTRENGLPRKRLSLPARLVLNEYEWPGNVRELEHCIERAVIMSEGTEITEADLPPGILIWKEMGGPTPAGGAGPKGGLSQILRQVERRAVLEALERSGGVQARAARLLGISERSMWYRVKKLGLQNQVS